MQQTQHINMRSCRKIKRIVNDRDVDVKSQMLMGECKCQVHPMWDDHGDSSCAHLLSEGDR